MPLRVAVQMDPLETINISGDSTFALMLKAQELGHTLYYYAPEDLSYAEGRLWTMAYPVTVQRVTGDHYSFGEPRILDLGRDVDVVLMRQDPPFDLGYITATHLLEPIREETLVVNDGAVAGAINRVPGEGEIRSNLAVGGQAAKTELTDREEEICAALGPELQKRGIIFAGIDVIGGRWLTEINVTSPTGIVAIDKFNDTDTPALIWQAIERRLGK